MLVRLYVLDQWQTGNLSRGTAGIGPGDPDLGKQEFYFNSIRSYYFKWTLLKKIMLILRYLYMSETQST